VKVSEHDSPSAVSSRLLRSGFAPRVMATSSGFSATIASSFPCRIPPGSQSLGAEPITARFWNICGAVM
jgi:hypothetical protein